MGASANAVDSPPLEGRPVILGTLEAWANFYVIVGSAAGALTGLQFVVMTLITQAESVGGNEDTLSAFGSPNVVHFCAALLIAAIMASPWHSLRQAGIAIALCGVVGVVYGVMVFQKARQQGSYQPVWEDWVWHTILPVLAYVLLLVGGLVLGPHASGPLFAIGAATLLLVYVGIHNAWDTVTYVSVQQMRRAQAKRDAAKQAKAAAPNPTGAPPPP